MHHRSNARDMRSPQPEHGAQVRRKKAAAAANAATAQEDDGHLFSKSYAKQHPNEGLHHRGQGR